MFSAIIDLYFWCKWPSSFWILSHKLFKNNPCALHVLFNSKELLEAEISLKTHLSQKSEPVAVSWNLVRPEAFKWV